MRVEESVIAWFYRALRNAIIDHHRRAGSSGRALERLVGELADAAAPPPELHKSVCQCVGRLADDLKAEYADLLREIDVNGMSVVDYMMLKDWIVAVLMVGLAGCSVGKDEIKSVPSAEPPKAAPTETAAAPAKAGGPIEIAVTEGGFQPDKIAVKKGEPVTFAFTRKTDKTCAKEVVIQVSPSEKIEKALPLDQRVEVTTTFPNSGEVKYACGMNMISGVTSVQ